ncbi:hypothetical protein BDK51DRAFT_26754, partial [Blyttiomyces helicus]
MYVRPMVEDDFDHPDAGHKSIYAYDDKDNMEKMSTSAFKPKQSLGLNNKYADLFGNNAENGIDLSTVTNSNINNSNSNVKNSDIANNDKISTSSRNNVNVEKQIQADVDCHVKNLDKTENATGIVNNYDDNAKEENDDNNEMSFSICLPGFRHFNREITWLNALSVSFTNMTRVVGAAMMMK